MNKRDQDKESDMVSA